MKRSQFAALIAVGLVLAYGGRLAWRAHKNIVSLDVHNMPIREVVSKLRWQTWESITVHHDVDARITLEVDSQPLEGVLALITDQCEGRWSVAYPLYTTKAKLQLARKVAAGDYESETPPAGWTNWNSRVAFMAMAARRAAAAENTSDGASTNAQPVGFRGMGGGGPGGFGGFGGFGGTVESKPVTVDFTDQTPMEAAFALREFGQVKVVPEDGTERKVVLSIKDAPMDSAVSKLAKWVNRKWAKFYLIEPRGGGRPTQQEREMFAQMPRPDPEQMRQRFQNFQPSPEMQQRATQRVLDHIKNTTAEQRSEERQRRGGRGGFGGGRGGGGR
ncbi:MAG TPA: hypothetical protein VMB21_03640 [Candidatus Limnocylindria bacterium]|jgi:hypothetical protein|nr:hypothetical protein [Candidatus Limnocylindria bacterium]